MRNVFCAFYKETQSWIIATICSISILYYLREISAILHTKMAEAFIFATAIIILIVSIINCIAALFRLVWEQWFSLSKPADLFKATSDIKLNPSRIKSILLLLGGLVFVSMATHMILHPTKPSHFLYGWLGIIFFGVGIVAAALQLVPEASFLNVNHEGIQIRSLWHITSFNWSDIEKFGVAAYSTYYNGIHQKYSKVGIKFSPTCNHKQKRQWGSKELVGYEFTLPDNYGMRSEDLAELLNYKRDQYTRP